MFDETDLTRLYDTRSGFFLLVTLGNDILSKFDLSRTVSIRFLKPGEAFYWIPEFVPDTVNFQIGDRFEIDVPGERPVILEALSVNPIIFEIPNLLTPQEADEIVEKARPLLAPSTVGGTADTAQVSPIRTSEQVCGEH